MRKLLYILLCLPLLLVASLLFSCVDSSGNLVNFPDMSISANITGISHTQLTDIGSSTHPQLDNHLGATVAHGATGAVVGTTNSQELSAKTLNASIAKGTWTASEVWTLPPLTLGGSVAGGNVVMTNIGSLLIGSSTAYTADTLEVNAPLNSYTGMSMNHWGATGFLLSYYSISPGTSIGDFTAVGDGTNIGGFVFRGSDGTDWQNSSYIFAKVAGTVGADRVPGQLEFHLLSDAAPSVDTIVMTLRAAAGGIRFNTYGAGTITADANGNLTSVSDERLKDITGAYGTGLRAILHLNPILYRWRGSTGYDTVNTYAGLSAQNVLGYVPEAVGVSYNGTYSLDDRVLIATLINSIKELQDQIDVLNAKLKLTPYDRALEPDLGTSKMIKSPKPEEVKLLGIP